MKENRDELKKHYDLMNLADVQEYYKIGHTYATRLMRQKDFPSFKQGREWRVHLKDLQEWEQTQKLNKPA